MVFDLNIDPDVTRYTHDPVKDLAHAKWVLQTVIIPQYVLYNYGRWAVQIKQSGEFIGWCGLKFRPEKKEVDLGYRFKSSAWGQGYATEAALACIKYGFEKHGISRIVGRAVHENLASLRVLEKCGMKYIRDEFVDGQVAKTYEIHNPLIS